jgi:integrase
MGRPRKGTLGKPRYRKDGSAAFQARIWWNDGRYPVTLEGPEERAREEMEYIQMQSDRGEWDPGRGGPAKPLFRDFGDEWFERKKHEGLTQGTLDDYRATRDNHLNPFLGGYRMEDDQIDFDLAARFRKSLLEFISPKTGRHLEPRTINRIIVRAGEVVQDAVDREFMTRNPFRGSKCKVKVPHKRKDYLDSAASIEEMFRAAGEEDVEWSKDGRGKHLERRVMIELLYITGCRQDEMVHSRWRDYDLDLDDGEWHIAKSKTPAGCRDVKLPRHLVETLLDLRERRFRGDHNAFVFTQKDGHSPLCVSDTGELFKRVARRASRNLESEGRPPLPEDLKAHSARATFISAQAVLPETDVMTIAEEVGHSDINVTYRIYRRAMKKGEAEKRALARLYKHGPREKAHKGASTEPGDVIPLRKHAA